MANVRDRHEDLLIKLHLEMKEGRGQGERANKIGDEMNALWAELDDDDRDLFDELSEDLYLIEGKRLVAPMAEGETLDSVRKRTAIAFKERRDRDVLTLVRKLSEVDAQLAYVIGRCWERLGFLLGAVCFYDFAYEQQGKPVYAVSALEALVRANQIQEAVARVERIEGRLIVDGTLLLEAASILHRAVTRFDAEHHPELYERVVRMVEVAWIDPTALPSMRASGLLAAGFSYEHLGRSADALRAFERAVAIYPKEAPLVAHGLALLKTNRRQAVALFTMAAKQRTQFDWPYLYAAQSALEEQRFAEVEQFCEGGLSLTERPDLRGRFYEWSGIAAANLGRPSEEVMELFDRALAELPFDPTIRRNADAFAAFSGNRSWKVEPPDDAKTPTLLVLEKTVMPKQKRQVELPAAA